MNNKTIPSKKTGTSGTPEKKMFDFAFGRINYILMFVGIAVLALGYLLMIGGAPKDPNVFNEEVFSTRRLIVAPLVLLLGFVIEAIAIMKRSK